MNRTYSNNTVEEPAPPVHIRVPLRRVLEELADRLDADERRGLAAEGDRESGADAWGAWADNYRFTPAEEGDAR